MRYDYSEAIPASTTEDNPKRYACKLILGDLVQVHVYFPWGCAGLTGIRILHYEHQLFPTNPGEWFRGNEVLISFECAYQIRQGRNQFYVEGYNEDDFNPHSPVVSFDILPAGSLPQAFPGWIEG